MKGFFLSHSSLDKAFVKKVAYVLGRDSCWIDEWDMDVGDDLFERIDTALASFDLKVFVLFWSASSSRSSWVHEETNQIRMRALLRRDVKIVPVVLDATPRPLWMEHLLWIEGEDGPDAVARELKKHGDTPLSPAVIGRDAPDPSFQDRVNEANFIETMYRDPHKSIVLVVGLPGIGKSSLCRHVLQTVIPCSRVFWVDFEVTDSPALFYSLLAERTGLRIPEKILLRGEWESYWGNWIYPALDRSNDVFVFKNLHQVANDDGNLPEWVAKPMRDFCLPADANHLGILATVNRAVGLPSELEASCATLDLSNLDDEDIIRTLRVRLSSTFPRKNATQEQLERASKILLGYPLAAQFWASYAVRVGVEIALADPSPVQKRMNELVSDILSKCGITQEEQYALLILSLLRFPISAEAMVAELGISTKVLSRLKTSMLLQPNTDGLAVHGLLAKYVVEDSIVHNEVRAAHEKLGQYFKSKWQNSKEELGVTVTYGSQAFYHLLASGNSSEAINIRWSLVEETRGAIRDLYRMHQDESIVAIVESLIVTMDGKYDDQIMFYYALSLARRDQDETDREKSEGILRDLLKKKPDDRYYLCAYADRLAKWKRFEEAKEFYRRARAVAKERDPVPSARLGELFLHEKRYDDAEFFILEAYGRNPDDTRIIGSYALLLEEKKDYEKAFSVVREGLRRRANDVILNHRAGQILRKTNNKIQAVPYLTAAAESNMSPGSVTSLADLYLELGKVEDAKRVMSRCRASRDSSYYNVLGHIALKEGNFVEAERYFKSGKSISGEDVVYFGSCATLKLVQAEKAMEMLAFESAKAYLVDAEELIKKGLRLEPQNDALLRLRYESDGKRKTIVMKSQPQNL